MAIIVVMVNVGVTATVPIEVAIDLMIEVAIEVDIHPETEVGIVNARIILQELIESVNLIVIVPKEVAMQKVMVM